MSEPPGDSAPIVVKPTPAQFFTYRGGGAREMNWQWLTPEDHLVPNGNFYVHNRQPPPDIDANTWQLKVSSTDTAEPRAFSYDELRAMPAVTLLRVVDCGANGRSFFPKLTPGAEGAKWPPVGGTEWRWGAMGAAAWTGVRLRDVLLAAGIDLASGVDVLATGLDSADYSHVVAMEKACAEDSLLVYAMNGEQLPRDHGYPCRAFFGGWGGNANVKWLGSIFVSTKRLDLPKYQQSQVLIGPAYPQAEPVTVQNVKSAFELEWEETLRTAPAIELSGRAWSGAGQVVEVEVSAWRLEPGGTWESVWSPSWRIADLDRSRPDAEAWVRFTVEWSGPEVGHYRLMARATDEHGNTQPAPEAVPWNQHGLLYNGHVGHPVTILPPVAE